MIDFDFFPIGTALVGGKIIDTHTGELQQEDQTQMPPKTQGPNLTPPSPPQVTVVDKGSVTPPPPSLEEEHVQKEPSSQETLEPRATDEASKQGYIVEYVQQPSQDVEEQAIGSTETETTKEESLQQETPSKSDKRKEVVEHTPSSSSAKEMEKHIPRWFRKEIMRSAKN